MTLYEKVKALCEEKGVTIAKVERDCGIGNGTIGKWDARDSSPRVDTLRKVAEYLEVDIKELL